MIFRRDRFGDLVRRQLDLFAEEEADLLQEAQVAESGYDGAPREDAEEAYGDLQLVVDAVAESLADRRDAYSATLDDDASGTYEQAFDRAARKRFGSLARGL